jgi:hypothetical protein
MNICQIASQDLMACLQWVHQGIALARVPFFQQVLAIAAESHLVSASDYAIEQYQTFALSTSDLPTIETLIQRLEVWPTSPAERAEAKRTSQRQGISFADALDEIIHSTLCPDWILVEAEGRSLPNAVSIHSFLKEWQSIRDDLPPDGGMSLWPAGPGPQGPDSDEPNPQPLAKQQARQGTAANNSVVFSQQACISMALGLTNISGQSLIGLAGNTPIAPNLQQQIAQALGGNLPITIAWVQTGSGLRLQLQVSGKTIATDIQWEDLTNSTRLNNAIAIVNPQVQQEIKIALGNVTEIAKPTNQSIAITPPEITFVETPIVPNNNPIITTPNNTIEPLSDNIPEKDTTAAPKSIQEKPPELYAMDATASLSASNDTQPPSIRVTIAMADPVQGGCLLEVRPTTIMLIATSLKEAIATDNNQTLVTFFAGSDLQPTTSPIQGTSEADQFLLQSGTLKVVTYQSHDRFGLIGGLSYSDLTITETTVRSSGDTYLAYQISVKTTGETLAILLPRQFGNVIPTQTTAPTAAEFFTVESNGPAKSVIICDRLPNTNDLLPLTDTSSSLSDCSRRYRE